MVATLPEYSASSLNRKRTRDETDEPSLTAEEILRKYVFVGYPGYVGNVHTSDEEEFLEPQRRVLCLQQDGFQSSHFVLDSEGKAATCSICFESNDKLYGLTVGSLGDVGDPLFCFVKPFPIASENDDGTKSYLYQIMQLGQVVSKDVETDSLVFDISNPFVSERGLPEVDPLCAREPELHSLGPPQCTKAQMRCSSSGETSDAVVSDSYNRFPGTVSGVGDIGFVGYSEYGKFTLTGPGDAGALCVDANKKTMSMHHATCRCTDQWEDISYGVPLTSIIARHEILKTAFGVEKDHTAGTDTAQEQEQRDAAPLQLWNESEEEVETRDFAYFEVLRVNGSSYSVWENWE
ncbi:MAG: hypothetical protein SGILL_008437 [Bacillariaceae sp.]